MDARRASAFFSRRDIIRTRSTARSTRWRRPCAENNLTERLEEKMRDQYGFEIGTLEAYSGEAELEQLWEEINEAFYEAERGVRAPGRGRGGVRRRGVVGTTSITFPPEVIISLPPAGGKLTLSGFA